MPSKDMQGFLKHLAISLFVVAFLVFETRPVALWVGFFVLAINIVAGLTYVACMIRGEL